MEPLNTNILFTLARPIVVGSGASELSKDSEGGISTYPASFDRTSYTVYSDTYVPPPAQLRKDNLEYTRSVYKYLALPPDIDPRIAAFAEDLIEKERAVTRYDVAKAVEKHLQNDFGYSLDMKAGGADPLSDFLFNLREGHCEYFATAMAIMLRTQGIATRVVNGFSQGEYNDTADVYVVKQKNAHSWVEVYFPTERIWVPFDPTPFAGQNSAAGSGTLMGRINKYMEALETFWIQYFVTYDDQEQRSLFRSFKDSVSGYKDTGAYWFNEVRNRVADWWARLRGDEGLLSSAKAVGAGVGALLGASILVILFVWFWRRIAALGIWERIADLFRPGDKAVIVGFYAHLQDLLEAKGFVRKPHQTPLEFAYTTGFDEAIKITEKYNGVRFGGKELSDEEAGEIEKWFERIETTKEH
jgi:transglutaminase-like putative cysteine protease